MFTTKKADGRAHQNKYSDARLGQFQVIARVLESGGQRRVTTHSVPEPGFRIGGHHGRGLLLAIVSKTWSQLLLALERLQLKSNPQDCCSPATPADALEVLLDEYFAFAVAVTAAWPRKLASHLGGRPLLL
jgi:hypothetical protein